MILDYFRFENNEKNTILMFIAFMLLFIWACFFSQKIPINNGLGYDGVSYAHAVKIFPHYAHQFTEYRSTRILPSTIVVLGLHLFKLPSTDINIVYGFELLNFLSVIFAVILFWKFVIKFKINFNWRLIGFAGLFLNFPILTFTGYDPVLTDTLSFSLGIALFYFYFTNNQLFVFICGLLASFTFPTFPLTVTFLLLFPYRQKINLDNSPTTEPAVKFNLVAFLAASVLVALTLLVFMAIVGLPKLSFGTITNNVARYFSFLLTPQILSIVQPENLISTTLFSLLFSLVFMLLYVYFGLKYLFIPSYFTRNFFKQISFKSAGLTVAFLLLNHYILKYLSNGETELSPLTFLFIILKEFSVLPMINLVSACVYYGPLVFFILLFWKQICKQAMQAGLGCVLALSLSLLLSLGTESREFINFIGMYVFLLLLVIPKNQLYEPPKLLSVIFVLFSLFASKFWFHISFPTDQGFFMNFGPWMHLSAYVGQALLSLLATTLLWKISFPSKGIISP